MSEQESSFRRVDGKPWKWEFKTPPNLSMTSIEEAAEMLGPSFVYDLTVHPKRLLSARSFCRQLHATVMHNVLSPYINILTDETVGMEGWMLSAAGTSVGSPGVV